MFRLADKILLKCPILYLVKVNILIFLFFNRIVHANSEYLKMISPQIARSHACSPATWTAYKCCLSQYVVDLKKKKKNSIERAHHTHVKTCFKGP